MGELRQEMVQIVSQRDVRFQDRCLVLIPPWRPHLSGGHVAITHLRRPQMMVRNRWRPTIYLFMLLALSSRKRRNHPNDTSISVIRRRKPGRWNTSRFGLPRFGLFVSGMVQHLSLQKN
jgi:hypothetical protein